VKVAPGSLNFEMFTALQWREKATSFSKIALNTFKSDAVQGNNSQQKFCEIVDEGNIVSTTINNTLIFGVPPECEHDLDWLKEVPLPKTKTEKNLKMIMVAKLPPPKVKPLALNLNLSGRNSPVGGYDQPPAKGEPSDDLPPSPKRSLPDELPIDPPISPKRSACVEPTQQKTVSNGDISPRPRCSAHRKEAEFLCIDCHEWGCEGNPSRR
jgi:hypothetical protein